MKTNKLKKKLMLNKKTLINLNSLELGNIRGGTELTVSCLSNCVTFCLQKCPDTVYTEAPDTCPSYITYENTCYPCFP